MQEPRARSARRVEDIIGKASASGGKDAGYAADGTLVPRTVAGLGILVCASGRSLEVVSKRLSIGLGRLCYYCAAIRRILSYQILGRLNPDPRLVA